MFRSFCTNCVELNKIVKIENNSNVYMINIFLNQGTQLSAISDPV